MLSRVMSDQAKIVDALQQLVQVLGGSLPMYLANALPWTARGNEKSAETLSLVVHDQGQTLARAVTMIVGLGGVAEQPSFPAGFTSLNDVSLDYLLQRLSAEQTEIVPRLERLATILPAGSPARDLIEEAAGAARGHAQTFEEASGTLTVH